LFQYTIRPNQHVALPSDTVITRYPCGLSGRRIARADEELRLAEEQRKRALSEAQAELKLQRTVYQRARRVTRGHPPEHVRIPYEAAMARVRELRASAPKKPAKPKKPRRPGLKVRR
jgi:hypothetical protein